ncbi:hypothetical protein HPP92_012113, partial [Vanilla planifolia]
MAEEDWSLADLQIGNFMGDGECGKVAFERRRKWIRFYELKLEKNKFHVDFEVICRPG